MSSVQKILYEKWGFPLVRAAMAVKIESFNPCRPGGVCVHATFRF